MLAAARVGKDPQGHPQAQENFSALSFKILLFMPATISMSFRDCS